MLATLSPKDEVFDKDYLPPAKPTAKETIKTVELPAKFLHGLPYSKKKNKGIRLRMVGQGRAKQKLENMKAMRERMGKLIE